MRLLLSGRTLAPDPTPESEPRAERRVLHWLLPLSIALLSLVYSLWVTLEVFERIPHNEDELAFVFQSRVFAGGALSAPEPPQPHAFFAPFVIDLNRVRFGKYPPGFPLMLAPGSLVGAPWLVNPLLGAASLALLYAFGARYFSRPAGAVAALLGAISPFFLEYSGSLMSHTATLFVSLLAIWFYADAWFKGSWRSALLCGICFGLAFLSRPATALGLGAPFAVHALWLMSRGRVRSFGLPLLVGVVPLVIALPLFNYAVSRQVLLSMYELWWPFDRFGFGEGIGTLDRHTPEMGLRYVLLNVRQVAPILLGWPLAGTLAFGLFVAEVVMLAATALWSFRPGAQRPLPRVLMLEALLVMSVITLIIAYIPYWAPHPRYYYEGLGGFLLVSALGALRLLGFIAPPKPLRWAIAAGAGLVLAIGALTTSPDYLWTLHHKNFFTRERLDAVEQAGLTNALVMVVQEGDWSDYGSVFPANSPWLDGDVVYALSSTPSTLRRLREQFPDRVVYELRGSQLRRIN